MNHYRQQIVSLWYVDYTATYTSWGQPMAPCYQRNHDSSYTKVCGFLVATHPPCVLFSMLCNSHSLCNTMLSQRPHELSSLEDIPTPKNRPYVKRTHEPRATHTTHQEILLPIGSHFFYITYLLNQQYLSVLKLQHYIKKGPWATYTAKVINEIDTAKETRKEPVDFTRIYTVHRSIQPRVCCKEDRRSAFQKSCSKNQLQELHASLLASPPQRWWRKQVTLRTHPHYRLHWISRNCHYHGGEMQSLFLCCRKIWSAWAAMPCSSLLWGATRAR